MNAPRKESANELRKLLVYPEVSDEKRTEILEQNIDEMTYNHVDIQRVRTMIVSYRNIGRLAPRVIPDDVLAPEYNPS